jgi:hypothetical protein
MWPSVAKIVPEHRLGTAYATMFTVQNYGLAAFFWGIGKVLDLSNPAVIKKLADARDALTTQGINAADVTIKIKQMQIAKELPYYNYTVPISMLVVLGVISIYLALMLKKADKKQGYGLEKPSGHRKEDIILEAENQANVE